MRWRGTLVSSTVVPSPGPLLLRAILLVTSSWELLHFTGLDSRQLTTQELLIMHRSIKCHIRGPA
ncbi:hypothetical protein M404DRAFT_993482 [Pisolithus tinctorius Marx 270]|uniref:Uncharacterized protein n=1 Tax=Pisolithus tinctorius Marx 270 TaxID=870435 RepID=A0A0C3KSK1_PISTI|nr:hypothetical protein M404DRAFT_993482 [Pisolithus tinctorius Marx 270]